MYDAKEEFANDLIAQAIKANADYQGGYALGCPLGRVIISKIAVKVARQFDCQVIAHGCTGKGNDQVRFEGYITTLNPALKVIAPVREWGMGRDEELEYARVLSIMLSSPNKFRFMKFPLNKQKIKVIPMTKTCGVTQQKEVR